MLVLDVETMEGFDEDKEEFVYSKKFSLRLEHSLVSVSKWEQEFGIAFLDNKDKTQEQLGAYIKFMIVDEDYPPDFLDYLTQKHVDQINDYMNKTMTATTFNDRNQRRNNNEVVTAEIIYNWMIALNIPFEFRTSHLNSLLTQIKVVSAKQEKPKPMSKSSAAAERQRIMAQRRAQYNTKG